MRAAGSAAQSGMVWKLREQRRRIPASCPDAGGLSLRFRCPSPSSAPLLVPCGSVQHETNHELGTSTRSMPVSACKYLGIYLGTYWTEYPPYTNDTSSGSASQAEKKIHQLQMPYFRELTHCRRSQADHSEGYGRTNRALFDPHFSPCDRDVGGIGKVPFQRSSQVFCCGQLKRPIGPRFVLRKAKDEAENGLPQSRPSRYLIMVLFIS